MNLSVNVKQLGKRKNVIESKKFSIDPVPSTTAELIIAIVIRQVQEYNERLEQIDLLKYLTEEEIKKKSVSGKISFQVNYNGMAANAQKAVYNALQSFEDGIFRVFLNDRELESLNDAICLKEEDTLTFIRLTMLAGRIW